LVILFYPSVKQPESMQDAGFKLFTYGTLVVIHRRAPSTTIVTYANSLDPDEMASNSPSHPDPSCLTHKTTFSPTFSDIEAL